MGIAIAKSNDHRAVQDAYLEQIKFGSAPKSALNLAMIVYLQRHPTVPAEEARACVDEILEDQVRNQ